MTQPMQMPTQMDRIIREDECKYLSGLSRVTRYRLEKIGLFPKHVVIAHGISGWRLSEVQNWIANLPNAANDPEY